MNKKYILVNLKHRLKDKLLDVYSLSHTFLIIAIIIGIITTCVVGTYAEKTQSDLAKNVLRLHIIPNSNSAADQALKLKVRDEILKKMSQKFNLSDSIDETKTIAKDNIDNIKSIAKKVIAENGKDYDVTISIGKSYFPTKKYGDISFPPGNYDAVIVRIGSAKGSNWWCVMFPPLCFVDATNGSMSQESKDKLKNTITDEEYKLINSNNGDIQFKAKFKVVEVWESSKHSAQVAIGKLF